MAVKTHYQMLTQYANIPGHQQHIASAFGMLANSLQSYVPEGPEKLVMFRKLLEARDSALRE